MIDMPRIVQTSARQIAFIHLTFTPAEMMQTFGSSVAELLAELDAQGITPAGPIFTHHLRRPTATFDFELSVPVNVPVVAAGRVRPGVWPVMTVAQTVYTGPYEGLPNAWGEFINWIETNDYIATPDLWECYVSGPESSPDPTTWRTELNQPLAMIA